MRKSTENLFQNNSLLSWQLELPTIHSNFVNRFLKGSWESLLFLLSHLSTKNGFFFEDRVGLWEKVEVAGGRGWWIEYSSTMMWLAKNCFIDKVMGWCVILVQQFNCFFTILIFFFSPLLKDQVDAQRNPFIVGRRSGNKNNEDLQ